LIFLSVCENNPLLICSLRSQIKTLGTSKLKGAKRVKEILFGGKAPPMAGAILMFLRLAFGKPLHQLSSCC